MISISHWGMFERFGNPNETTIAAIKELDRPPSYDAQYLHRQDYQLYFNEIPAKDKS